MHYYLDGIQEVVFLKKQVMAIVSTVLKTLYLTPVIVSITLMGFRAGFAFFTGVLPFSDGIPMSSDTFMLLLSVACILVILDLFLVLICDTFILFGEKGSGRLSDFSRTNTARTCLVVAIAMPVICSIALIAYGSQFGELLIYRAVVELFRIGNGIVLVIGPACLLSAFIIDMAQKTSRITTLRCFLYLFYLIIPVFWFAVLFYASPL